jgi:RNA polymerase sporulation-specific sigma factor
VPLTGYGEEDEEEKILDFLVSNPEEIFIDKENMEIIEGKISDGLSSLEQTVLYLYVKGNSYREISEILKKEPKSIDNALQRLKKKMVDIIENSD